RRDDQKKSTDDEKCETIGPQVPDARAAKNDSSRDVDEIRGGDDVADGIEDGGNRFARENVSRKKDTGQNGKKCKLHGFRLRSGFAGNENPQRESGEEIRQREKSEQQDAAVNRNKKNKVHGKKNEAELKETDAQVGK